MKERTMNEENDWDHNIEGDAVDCLCRDKVVPELNKMDITCITGVDC